MNIDKLNLEEAYIKYPSIPYLKKSNHQVNGLIYEKKDGKNCQLRIENGIVVPGTRSKRTSDYKRPRQHWINEFSRYSREKVFPEDILDYQILFFEWMENGHPLVLIDVYDINSHRFLDYEIAIKTYQNLSWLKVLESLSGKSNHTYNDIHELTLSLFEKNNSLEGVVIKDYEEQNYSKFVCEQIDVLFQSFVPSELINQALKSFKKTNDQAKMICDLSYKKSQRSIHYDIVLEFLKKNESFI